MNRAFYDFVVDSVSEHPPLVQDLFFSIAYKNGLEIANTVLITCIKRYGSVEEFEVNLAYRSKKTRCFVTKTISKLQKVA